MPKKKKGNHKGKDFIASRMLSNLVSKVAIYLNTFSFSLAAVRVFFLPLVSTNLLGYALKREVCERCVCVCARNLSCLRFFVILQITCASWWHDKQS